MSNITVESKTIVEQLESFKAEMTKLDSLMDKIDSKSNAISQSWEGNVSDTILSSIRSFRSTFDNIRAQNEKYVTFLNGVIEKYTDEDSSETSFVNDNKYAFTSDLYGKN